jgi:hypothetical protein
MRLDTTGYYCCEECDWGTVHIGLWDSAGCIWSSNDIYRDDVCFEEKDIQQLRDELKAKLEELDMSDLYNPAIDSNDCIYDWSLIGEDDE